MRSLAAMMVLLGLIAFNSRGEVLDPAMHHLRHGEGREWDDFPERAEADELRIAFDAKADGAERALRLRHRDLRHVWKVVLNGKDLAKLPQDDNAMVSLIAVPAGALRGGANELRVVCAEKSAEVDDVEIGDVELLDRSLKEVLSEATIDVSVVDGELSKAIPCRLTILDSRGMMMPLGIESTSAQAVRAGVVYTGAGATTLRLPAGLYTIYAGRGFEWGIDSVKVDLKAGVNDAKRLVIRREVDTAGYVAADTHIHTFTYSRHGDATLAERMITLAGEGIELAIATDHNLPVDYEEAARAGGVRRYFTPVIGNEVTTAKLGHFNVFPITKGGAIINFRAPTWEKLFDSIDALSPAAVVILNHARDDHGGFRPFDPIRHISTTGENLDGQDLRANAMEVINSGATLNDAMLLYRDWMGCLNRGLRLTPVGASDSHDVSRFIVGQGRTYVRAEDNDPGKIDIGRACDAIRKGNVLVSYGLLVELKVNGRFGPGELAAVAGEVVIEVMVSGPAWTRADRVALYANGIKIREAAIDAASGGRAGLKSAVTWRIPKLAQDVFLTAISTGPGVTELYWPAAKPYQRTNSHWVPYVMGCTGAVFVDADGSGTFESAFDYARHVVDAAGADVAMTMKGLEGYDASVTAQAASLLRAKGKLTTPEALDEAAKAGTQTVLDGFSAYSKAWRESDAARSTQASRTPSAP
jgi:hypothetical protein